MTKELVPIEALINEVHTMQWKGGALQKGLVDRICHCGTCEDARRAALRLYVQSREHHCPYWTIQIMATLKTLSLMDMLMIDGATDEQLTLKSGDESDPAHGDYVVVSLAEVHLWQATFDAATYAVPSEFLNEALVELRKIEARKTN